MDRKEFSKSRSVGTLPGTHSLITFVPRRIVGRWWLWYALGLTYGQQRIMSCKSPG